MTSEGKSCQGDGCEQPAKMRCPTCIKLNLPDSFFCDQECFKKNWGNHKAVHAVAESNALYNPWPAYKFTGELRPARLSATRQVPKHIPVPDYVHHPEGVSFEELQAKRNREVKVLTDEEIEGLRVACRLGREVLNEAAKAVAPGVTTDELDRVVHEACVERDCYPSPLGYHKFPKSCCTSVNEVICHGIPDMRKLEDGDLCNVDVTVYHRGFHGDLNESFFVGKVDEASKQLVSVTYECLQKAIEIVRPGVKFREIGDVIQKHANAHGFSVVKTYCGHGIHRLFHTAPNVPHYAMPLWERGIWEVLYLTGIATGDGENTAKGVMKAGNAFTIEPMINAGSYKDDRWPDDWTAVTADGKRSAQFEQTLLVTENGCDILTARSTGQPWFREQC